MKGFNGESQQSLLGEKAENDYLTVGIVYNEDNSIKVYMYRWLIVLLFATAGISNALILLTWSPITDKAQIYWNGIGLTEINLLNVIFQIMYLPGTLFALRVSEKNNLRVYLLTSSSITATGCAIRLIGSLLRFQVGSSASYALVLFGTTLVGLAQPFYLNLPAKIAGVWFPVNERDIATTLCSLAAPFGSAVGSFIPPLFITDDDKHSISDGINNLLTTQLSISVSAFIILYILFRPQPPSPPSSSATTMLNNKGTSMLKESWNLLANYEYRKLFFAFTLILGNLNALAALLNQLPGGYTNGQIGTTGAVLIICGFLGAFATGFIIEYSKAYQTVLKTAYLCAFVAWIFFMANCHPNNFPLFIFGAALLGLVTLPSIPSTIVASVECAYPVPEDAAVGFLYVGANTMAIAMTFIGQVLLAMDSDFKAPFFPYGIWITCTLFVSVITIITFKGKYLRLEQDSHI
eukprot:gene9236-12450_t